MNKQQQGYIILFLSCLPCLSCFCHLIATNGIKQSEKQDFSTYFVFPEQHECVVSHEHPLPVRQPQSACGVHLQSLHGQLFASA